MAFTYTVNSPTDAAGKKIATGTYTSAGGSTGGDIVTGLRYVECVQLQSKGSAVVADAPVVNETLPLSSGSVTIVTAANEVGNWLAIGL